MLSISQLLPQAQQFFSTLGALAVLNLLTVIPLVIASANRLVRYRYGMYTSETYRSRSNHVVIKALRGLVFIGFPSFVCFYAAFFGALAFSGPRNIAAGFVPFLFLIYFVAYASILFTGFYELNYKRWITSGALSDAFSGPAHLVMDELYRRAWPKRLVFAVANLVIVQAALVGAARFYELRRAELADPDYPAWLIITAEAFVSFILVCLLYYVHSFLRPDHDVVAYAVHNVRPSEFVEEGEPSLRDLSGEMLRRGRRRSSEHRHGFRIARQLERCSRFFEKWLSEDQYQQVDRAISALSGSMRRTFDLGDDQRRVSQHVLEWAAALVTHRDPASVASKILVHFDVPENRRERGNGRLAESITSMNEALSGLMQLLKFVGFLALIAAFFFLGRQSDLFETFKKFVGG